MSILQNEWGIRQVGILEMRGEEGRGDVVGSA